MSFTVYISNSYFLLLTEPPVIIREPPNSVVEEGGEVDLECEVEGAPFPSILWLLNGESVENDSHIHAEGKIRISQTFHKLNHLNSLHYLETNFMVKK